MKISQKGISNAVEAVGNAVGALAAGRKIIVDLPVRKERRSLCAECKENINGQCRLCECIIQLKTMLSSERCPLGLWERSEK